MGVELIRWDQLDPETQKALDAQYREELERVAGPGLTPDALDEYLEYRHRRPEAHPSGADDRDPHACPSRKRG